MHSLEHPDFTGTQILDPLQCSALWRIFGAVLGTLFEHPDFCAELIRRATLKIGELERGTPTLDYQQHCTLTIHQMKSSWQGCLGGLLLHLDLEVPAITHILLSVVCLLPAVPLRHTAHPGMQRLQV